MRGEVCEYEILVESIGKYAGEGQMAREIIEAECDDPIEYVKEHDSWPLFDTMTHANGDVVIITKSGEGNIRKYTFMKC